MFAKSLHFSALQKFLCLSRHLLIQRKVVLILMIESNVEMISRLRHFVLVDPRMSRVLGNSHDCLQLGRFHFSNGFSSNFGPVKLA